VGGGRARSSCRWERDRIALASRRRRVSGANGLLGVLGRNRQSCHRDSNSTSCRNPKTCSSTSTTPPSSLFTSLSIRSRQDTGTRNRNCTLSIRHRHEIDAPPLHAFPVHGPLGWHPVFFDIRQVHLRSGGGENFTSTQVQVKPSRRLQTHSQDTSKPIGPESATMARRSAPGRNRTPSDSRPSPSSSLHKIFTCTN